MGSAPKVEWNIDLTALMNKPVVLETKEGHVRTGKVTAVEWQDLKLNDVIVQVPVEIELDGSWTERVPFAQLVRLQRQE